ncbi:hypothetical protein BD413DRAFT_248829 [Trametes elegans]|nr:hypothetical protein BD413DRAFT_248829 [Trametes elegans]
MRRDLTGRWGDVCPSQNRHTDCQGRRTSEDTIYKWTGFLTKINDILQTYPVLSPPRVVIRHNFQHGVESIFWILSWLLFTHIKGQNCTNIIAKISLSINVHSLSSRRRFLSDNDASRDSHYSLRRDLPPNLLVGLHLMCIRLHEGYLARASSIGDRSSY